MLKVQKGKRPTIPPTIEDFRVVLWMKDEQVIASKYGNNERVVTGDMRDAYAPGSYIMQYIDWDAFHAAEQAYVRLLSGADDVVVHPLVVDHPHKKAIAYHVTTFTDGSDEAIRSTVELFRIANGEVVIG